MGTEGVAQEGPSFAPKRVPRMSFDDLVKRRTEQPRRTTGMDVPPEIRWTGVGRQLSDFSIPNPRRHLDVGLLSPPAEPQLPPPDSSNSSSESDDNTEQDIGRAEVPLMQKHSSLDTFDTLKAASEARNERKGLGALKVMSSERLMWDTTDENLAKSESPLFEDYGPQGDTRFDYRKSEEVRSSTLRVTDLLYGIPRYRRHDIGGTGPPQEAPPPIPATPPPYEAVGLTWRSPQSSTTEESVRSALTPQNLAGYSDFSNENISEV
ncbi:hypothetical protein VZT92_021690 [Zoarces viviparus]|uniref:Uncharacterized protein n=1 Tax=Zoarces viviparus TaxID=48416 RepID=A0AAW1E918_ZOAVI